VRRNTQLKLVRCLVATAILLVGLSGSRCFADIWMDPGDVLSDTLTVGAGEIVAGGSWGAGTSFYYEVTRPLDETLPLHYEYTFFAVPSSPALSHFILQVSQAVVGGLPAFDPYDPTDYFDGPTVEGQATSYGPAPGNPGFPAGQSIWGIKFQEDMPLWTIEFDSYRLPMLGDFYAKGGFDSFAYNSGLGNLDGANILVPNSSYVPLPGAVLLGMLGLGIAGWKLRRFA